jgi:hypothetical protein
MQSTVRTAWDGLARQLYRAKRDSYEPWSRRTVLSRLRSRTSPACPDGEDGFDSVLLVAALGLRL